jgi:hypothetical protein
MYTLHYHYLAVCWYQLGGAGGGGEVWLSAFSMCDIVAVYSVYTAVEYEEHIN